MATYKVIQDIEAEDKFLGPLTLKQFIFAAIAAIGLYISFWTLSKGIWIVSLIFLPFIISTGFLAWPWGREQPTEIWLVAKIRYMLKPRRRIWDQSGQAELVTITAPKIEGPRFSDISQTEVKSRLQSLANMLDSRGWAVKNVNVNLYEQPSSALTESDRLVAPSALPRDVPSFEVLPADDILDPATNRVAAHLDQMISASTASHRQETLENIKRLSAAPPAPAPNYWFMNQPAGQAGQPAAGPAPTSEEQAVLERVKTEKAHPRDAYGNTKVLAPSDQKSSGQTAQSPPAAGLPAGQAGLANANPAILGLANNDDLNVATIARQAKREQQKQAGNDEVIISLR